MKLRVEGLIREVPRRGSYVAELTLRDVREIYDLRAAIEAHSARRLIQFDQKNAFERLSKVLEAMGNASESNNWAEFARLDLNYHEELTNQAQNRRIHESFVNHTGLLRTLLRLEVHTQYESLDGLFQEHEWLHAEISSKDVSRAEAACYQHLEQAAERVVAMCELRES